MAMRRQNDGKRLPLCGDARQFNVAAPIVVGEGDKAAIIGRRMPGH